MDKLLEETIQSYNNYLSNIPKGCQYIADLIREDSLMAAMHHITDFSEGVLWLMNASELFEKNSLISELNTDKINDFLNEINSGLEIQDYIIVADMFEYEIKPFFEECKTYEIN